MAQVEIISVQQFPATDVKRLGQFDSLVVYRISGGRHNSVVIPKTPVEAKDIEASIIAQQKSIAPLIGHKFDIK